MTSLQKPESSRSKSVMDSSRFVADQRFHFLVVVAIPTVLAVAGAFALPSAAFDAWGIAICLVTWILVGGLGVSVGYHRLSAHRALTCSRATHWLLGALGSMAGQGPIRYWVALHRRHHALADQPGDVHSPSIQAQGGESAWRAFWLGHIGWTLKHDVPRVSRYARDMVNDPMYTTLSQWYWVFFASGFVLPALVGLLHWGPVGLLYGAYWGGVVRLAIGHHLIWSLNSICHSIGSRDHATSDRSTNFSVLALLTFGESWHNNHHAAPTSAKFGMKRGQIDPGWWLISLLAKFDRQLQIRDDRLVRERAPR